MLDSLFYDPSMGPNIQIYMGVSMGESPRPRNYYHTF